MRIEIETGGKTEIETEMTFTVGGPPRLSAIVEIVLDHDKLVLLALKALQSKAKAKKAVDGPIKVRLFDIAELA